MVRRARQHFHSAGATVAGAAFRRCVHAGSGNGVENGLPRLHADQFLRLAQFDLERAVAGELYAFLTGRAMALDMDGKTAVLALIEEAFINRPGSVADALTKFVED